MIVSVLGVVIVVCSLICLEWLMNRHERASLFRQIPGPPTALFLGNLLDVAVSPVVPFAKLRQWSNMHQDIFRLWMMQHGIVAIYNPRDVETVLSDSTHSDKSRLYDCLKPWLKDGLLLSKAIFEENSTRLVQHLEKSEHEQTLDVNFLMSDYTLNSICETAMGTRLDKDDFNDGNAYKKSIHEMGKLIVYRISNALLVFDSIFKFSLLKMKQSKILNVIHNFPTKIIAERRNYIDKRGFKVPSNINEDNFMLGPVTRRMAMLDLLLYAEKEGLIKEEGIQEEVDTFMFEGHDTTALGLAYVLLELANNRNIQDRVCEEVMEILGDSTGAATMQELGQLKYLECCIKETLRLYPPVPIISRAIEKNVTLSGYTVPHGKMEKKTVCQILIFDLHRRVDLYPEPLTFDPERFTPENSVHRHPYAYIPFSGGPRNCIGQKFAMLEMKSVVSSILRKFTLEPVTKPEHLEFTTDLVLRTTHPIYVKFVKRY